MEHVLKGGPDKVLEQTLEDLQIRAEVEATVQSMLVDVEVTASLQKELEFQTELTKLRQQVSQYEHALSETQAVQSHQRQEQGSLADSLVQELWTLSQELGQLRRWKETHETTISEHDEVIARLLQAEEQIRVLKSTPEASHGTAETYHAGELPASSPEAESTTVATIPSANALQDTPVVLPAVSDQASLLDSKPEVSGPQQKGPKADKDKPDTDGSIEKDLDDLLAAEPNEDETESNALTSNGAPPVQSQQPDPSDAVQKNATSTDRGVDDDAVVALLQEVQEDIPTLDTLDMKILANIFEFLDALEILNTAQINITMFSRVDALFGLGGAPEGADDNVVAPSAGIAQDNEPPLQPPSVASAPPAAVPPINPSPPPSMSNSALTTASAQQQPTADPFSDVKMPAQSTVSNAMARPTSTSVAPRRGGIFSLLQARGGGGSVSLPRRSGAVAGSAADQQPLSAAMTDSMVAKLTDKELGAIFSLTEKLHQREKAVTALTVEKEELAGKLEGTEALKGFLIDKVRDIERSLRKSQEDEMKVAQQISSDQEVIAFLDSRVQQLERDIKLLSDEKKRIAEQMSQAQSQNDKKMEVLGDMLQFERERVSENEREWKATKKLLVKEIKSCRAQLLALQAERDGFREQNERLRKAVLLTNPTMGGSM